MGGRMSDDLRVGDGTTGEPDGTQPPAREEVEEVPEAEVVEVPGVPEPDDDDLSPWYADLEDDDPDLPPEEAAAGDGSEDESPEESVSGSLRVSPLDDEGVPVKRSPWRGRGRRLVKKEPGEQRYFRPEERLLLLDTWQRSGLPAKDFSGLVGVSKHTLYSWKKRFDDQGPAGLVDAPRGARKGSRLPEVTKRAILMLKEGNPAYGVQRISDMLFRGPGLPASPSAVARVLHEAGYVLEERPTVPHPDKVRSFERAKPNQLWQTDIFTFVLKRQNRRVYLVAFMDDHSRFVVGYGLHATASSALVLEVLRSAIASYGTPEEILTDNGSQYVTWRGKSAFAKECEKRGIRQIVARPRHPQTLGKVERFWGTLWRECVQSSVFIDLGDARTRIGHFIDHANFQRPHQGIGGLVPADRYFGAAPEVLAALKERVAANALEIARSGVPKRPFYLAGNVGGRNFSVHAEGERIVMRREDGEAEEVELVPPSETEELPEPVAPAGTVGPDSGPGFEEPPAPGTSAIDSGISEGGGV
jgi:transposase InsO family protein